MASSRKKRSRAVVTLLLCLAAVCIVAALVLYGLANRKLKALQRGADFQFTYARHLRGRHHPPGPLLHSGPGRGHRSRIMASLPGQLQLYLYSPRYRHHRDQRRQSFFLPMYC